MHFPFLFRVSWERYLTAPSFTYNYRECALQSSLQLLVHRQLLDNGIRSESIALDHLTRQFWWTWTGCISRAGTVQTYFIPRAGITSCQSFARPQKHDGKHLRNMCTCALWNIITLTQLIIALLAKFASSFWHFGIIDRIVIPISERF